MRAGEFAELTAFVAVAEARSFRNAAAKLGLSASTLSHALRSLEQRLGARLLNRTTRSVALTDAGARLLRQLTPALAALGNAVDVARDGDHGVGGSVRINAPHLAITSVLAPIVGRLASDHPNVTLHVTVEENAGDIVRAGFDAGIRLGERVDADMIAVCVSPPFTTAIVASPDYFERFKRPDHPRDLLRHRCIGCRSGPEGALYRWEFEKGGKRMALSLTGPLDTDSLDLMIAAALDGVGLWHGVESVIADQLAAGRLVRVLEDWSPSYPGFFLYYPSGAPISSALRTVIDLIRNRRQGSTARSEFTYGRP
jgi:DNA-binding transcriptional LysR family regulator